MKRITVLCLAMSVLMLMCPRNISAQEQYDVVVYGGTSAAVTTAVQVKKMGKSVVIVSPDKHLGGLTSGGLGFTDSGNVGSIGGLSREFYHRVYLEYQKPETWQWQKMSEYGNQGQGTKAMLHDDQTMWIFEPHVAERVYDQWVAEYEIPVVRDAWLDRENGVEKDGTRIVSITTLDGKTYRGKMFIDVTYEGDLMAAAGVGYHVGREPNSQYGENWNGNQYGVFHHGHYFKKPVDPYKTPGDPSSGLLKHVDDSSEGVNGEGDHRIQAYCFRMCLTRNPANRVPFPKPDNYNPEDYELLRRVFETGWRETFDKFDPIPNLKTDTNNHGPFSTDFIGMNYDYPEASYERRREIIREHYNYQAGWFYYIANDPGVPDDVRNRMAQWGLAKDEFVDNEFPHWPHQLYIREARRMIGGYVMTELDCLGRKRAPRPVGMGSYTLDSHNVRRFVAESGYVQNEGDIGVHARQPYGIDYGSLLPKADECTNLLVPVCVSCTHIAFGSIRMEPVFMLLGQSAGTAAVMSIDDNVAVQQLDYEKLRERLLADGQRLESESTASYIDPAKLDGLVIENDDATLRGNWPASTSREKFVGNDYLHDDNEAKGQKSAVYTFEIKQPDRYEVRVSYSQDGNRATNVPVAIRHKSGETTAKVNQKNKPSVDGLFEPVGTFEFDGQAVVTISNTGTNGHVIIDAVQVLPK